MSRFVEAVGLTVLAPETFEPQGIGPGNRAAGGKVRPHFLAAVRCFAELLSKQHPDAHTTALISFDDLESYDLAHSAKLEVLVPLAAHDTRAAAIDVDASSELSLIAFRDPDALGRLEFGGMAVASRFGKEWTTALAPLWEIAWQRADPENLREKVRLAREDPTTGDPLKEIIDSAVGRKAAKALAGEDGVPDSDHDDAPGAKTAAPRPRPKPPARRKLRDLSNISFGEPHITGENQPGGRKHRRRVRLKDKPPGKPGPKPAKEPRGIREYDENDKEREGFKLLARRATYLTRSPSLAPRSSELSSSAAWRWATSS